MDPNYPDNVDPNTEAARGRDPTGKDGSNFLTKPEAFLKGGDLCWDSFLFSDWGCFFSVFEDPRFIELMLRTHRNYDQQHSERSCFLDSQFTMVQV